MSIRTEGVSPTRQKLRDCHKLALSCRLLSLELEQLVSGQGSRILRHIQKREERRQGVEGLLQPRLEQLTEKILEAESLLDRLPAKERVLMRAYYSEGFLWREVEPIVGYRKSHVDRIHRRAMKRLEHMVSSGQTQNRRRARLAPRRLNTHQ